MSVTIKTRRRCAGSYEIDAPSGTYLLRNCPVDTSDPFTVGLPRGPRWMLTNPGEYHADTEFPTKGEAVEYVRVNEQWKADQADQAAKESAVTEPEGTAVPETPAKRKCANCSQLATVAFTRPGAYTMWCCDHHAEVWREDAQRLGFDTHQDLASVPHFTEPQESTVTDTDFKPGQRIVVADGSTQTVVKMSCWANEPLRVEVEGGLQWLAENCHPALEQPAPVLCGHRKADPRGEYTDRIPIPARCESGTTYGLWDEYAGGFTYAGDCRYEVAAEAVTRLTDTADDNHDPDGEYKVLAICREHEEQPADTCEDCFAEGDEN